MTAQLEVQKAIKTVFDADTGAGGLRAAASPLVTGVHDFVQPNATPPYIVIGDATEQPAHVFGRRGFIVTASVEVWSESTQGFEPALLALKRMNALIDANPGVGESTALASALSALGWVLVSCRYTDAPGVRGQDGEVRSKAAKYVVHVQAAV